MAMRAGAYYRFVSYGFSEPQRNKSQNWR